MLEISARQADERKPTDPTRVPEQPSALPSRPESLSTQQDLAAAIFLSTVLVVEQMVEHSPARVRDRVPTPFQTLEPGSNLRIRIADQVRRLRSGE